MNTSPIKSTKVVTGQVRLSYAHIWVPYAQEEDQKPKYSVSLIIPKTDTATLKAIKAAVGIAKEQGAPKWGGKIPSTLKLPLRDGDEERPEDEVYNNSYFVNASCFTKPGIVDRTCLPIFDQDEVYSGCYAFASITFYPFNVSGNKGVACGLNHLMKVADGESLGGRVSAESDFGDILADTTRGLNAEEDEHFLG